MKLFELASTVRAVEVVQRCKHPVRTVLWLGLLLGVSVTGRSQEPPLPLRLPATENADQHCQNPLPDVPISKISVDIRPRDADGLVVPEDELPEDCNQYLSQAAMYSSLDLLMARGQGILRCWSGAQFCHRPLYFEEACLERWGVCHGCLQPAISGIKFFGTALLLPVKMWRSPPHSYVRTPPCF